MMLVINVLLFQLSWFACVLGAAHGLPWIGVLAAAPAIAWHLAHAKRAARELALIAAACVVGALFETLLLQAGWVRYSDGMLFEGTAPGWMVALWASFATTLNLSLRWLRPRWALAGLFAALAGPASYYAGARLGALELAAPTAALIAIGIGWSILTPALLQAAHWLDGSPQP
jgi:hypothetical protein